MKRNKEATETFAKNLKAALPLAGLDYTLDDVCLLYTARGCKQLVYRDGRFFVVQLIADVQPDEDDQNMDQQIDVYKRQMLSSAARISSTSQMLRSWVVFLGASTGTGLLMLSLIHI